MRRVIFCNLFIWLLLEKPQIGIGILDLDEGSGELVTNHKLWKLATKSDGSLPGCQMRKKRRRFVSEICNIVQPAEPGKLKKTDTEPTIIFQYCQCPNHWECSRSTRLDDPYTYAVIGDLQFKTCLAEHHLPLCRTDYGTVAKIWYGEDLPHRCPRGSVWGQLRCTSSGRICYVLNCSDF